MTGETVTSQSETPVRSLSEEDLTSAIHNTSWGDAPHQANSSRGEKGVATVPYEKGRSSDEREEAGMGVTRSKKWAATGLKRGGGAYGCGNSS